MIPTRIHGVIDYFVAAGFAGLSLHSGFSMRLRGVLAAAGAYHAGYSALTDYEAGLVRTITMDRHLRLDALGAAALCGAAFGMPRQAPRERNFLLAACLAEFAVVALSKRRTDAGRPVMAYPPLDELKRVADDVWIVDSVIGPGAPVRMTVIRLPGGELMLHSPTRYGTKLRRQLDGVGRVRHLLAPNIAHWTFVKEWQQAVAGATTWAAPGLRARTQVRRSGLVIDHDLAEEAPPEWSGQVDQSIIVGGAGFAEVAMFHKPSRTLVLTDLVVNLEAGKVPWLLRPLAGLLGILAPAGQAPAYLRAIIGLRRSKAETAAARLLGWQPEQVVFTHGRWFDRDGTRQLRKSLSWLLQDIRSGNRG